MALNGGKFYPPASSEIAKLLGLEKEDEQIAVPSVTGMVLPSNLPTLEAVVEHKTEQTSHDEHKVTGHNVDSTELPNKESAGRKIFLIMIRTLPYVAVFAVGVMVYYFFFADPSNRPVLVKKPDPATVQAKQKQEALEALESQEIKRYYTWVSQFFFDVTDNKITHPDTVGKNGLTNFENYLFGLNPKTYSALGGNVSDAQNILDGVNPKTGGPLPDRERDIIAKYLNVAAIRDRVATLPTSHGKVSGSTQYIRGIDNRPKIVEPAFPEPTSQSTPVPTPVSRPSASVPDCAVNNYNINTSIPGRLEVPSIGVNVPIIWSKSTSDFDTDLKTGVVHYPCTPLPGDIGTSYISGHSSNYAWVRADFNKVFAKMDQLAEGASFKVTVVNKAGKDVRFHYVVDKKQEFDINDQSQFTNYADSRVALSTCWPINTTKRRLVAFGKLTSID